MSPDQWDDSCSFCRLVLQMIGYDKLEPADKIKYAVHLKIAHGLKPEIEA